MREIAITLTDSELERLRAIRSVRFYGNRLLDVDAERRRLPVDSF